VVNAETVAKVTEIAEALGYRPHPMARGLRTNRTMTVGMVLPDVENPLFGPIIAGVEQELGQHGYSLLIANTDPRSEESLPLIDTLMRGRVDGLILATSDRKGSGLEDVLERGAPIVLVNRRAEGDKIPSVTGDDDVGIRLTLEHLIELGHTVIGHVAGPGSLSTGDSRRAAFERWAAALGVKRAPIEEAEWFRMEPGQRAGERLLAENPDVTAIVAANDLLALGVYRAIADIGCEVGVDVSVTGYNDVSFMQFVQPAMTSVRVQYREMGAEAALALLKLMSGWSEPVESVTLPPTLSIRASTAPPPA
jgi:LacI family transcriptional regulator